MILLAAVIGLSHLQTAAIDSIVTSVMRSHDVTGLSLGIARKDSTLYLRGYGWRDASRMHRVDGYTIYPIGSLTKQFTAALILQQIADGRLALDAGRPTVRQLMNQTVGGRWQYRNANYAALGSALERTTATPFCRLLATRIAAPLHLASTSCGIPAGAWNVADGSIAAAHYLAPAAGGLASNARDLLHWLDDLSTGRVVTPRYFTAMTSSGFVDGGVPTNYGFGFFIDDWYGYRVAEHSGYVDGYSSADALVLDDGLEMAALSNADRVDLVPLLKSIAAIVDRPLDANLSATPSAPPENEDPALTAAARSLLTTSGFSALGNLQSLEFVERTLRDGVTYDKYRATFSTGQWWVTLAYRNDHAIESVALSRIDP